MQPVEAQIWISNVQGSFLSEQIKMLLKLYAKEKHFLVVNQQKTDFEVLVSFKVRKKTSWNDLWVNK